MKSRRYAKRPKGTILVLTAFMMIGMLALVAFAVDLGYLNVARAELQRSADAAALAGAWALIDEDALVGYDNPSYLAEHARAYAAQFAQYNPVTSQNPSVDQQDLAVGYLANPTDPSSELLLDGSHPPNAVQVRVRKSSGVNGEVPLFFARALGTQSASMEAVATAALLTNIRGFRFPSTGENLGVLPFALDEETWIALIEDHVGTDNWTWNPETGEVESGGDGILEVNLFPQGTGSPGNRGTVDIGPSNNSTSDLARQITDGITQDDLDHIGGVLELDEDGFLYLNGDTGISAGMKDELASIIGQPRTILIFREVNGNGNNATFTIVGFAGIRITEVKLTGSMNSKRVTIQPAITLSKGGIPAAGDQISHFVYSPVWLVR
jgi:hypothetical protein